MKLSFPLSSQPSKYVSTDSSSSDLLDSSGAEAPSGSICYGLTVRDSKPRWQYKDEIEAGDPQLAALWRFQEDMKKLQENGGMEEFTVVPVDKFAASYLARYGWKEGMGRGRRNDGDTEEVQCDLSMLKI